MKYLITGVAGFIGNELARAILSSGSDTVVGIDNLNDYYDVELKKARLSRLTDSGHFLFCEGSVDDREFMSSLENEFEFDAVIHLAAQAGVRHSIKCPQAYVDSNLVGFGNILELVRRKCSGNFIFASSSSVYGENGEQPFSEAAIVNRPVSLYAATKIANEAMAYSYSHLYGIPVIGLRFFTVYGPWGRPDMAPFLFSRAILERRPIQVFNQGKMRRDFTYIDDVVAGILGTLKLNMPTVSQNAKSGDTTPYKIFNIGSSRPIQLMEFIKAIENATGLEAILEFKDMQMGDVSSTYADISRIRNETGYSPSMSLESGVQKTVSWFKNYYSL